MSTLGISIIQANLRWHDPLANRAMLGEQIAAIEESTDLIVLPEMFSTGFSMDAENLAEPPDGDSVRWMHEQSLATRAAVCGSLIIVDDGAYFNRFFCVMPDGTEVSYDKRHLFRLADEQHHYSPGDRRVVFELKGWRICPQICYDLRFPVWSRSRDDYDLLIYVANWPSRRHNAWQTLLRARAIENLSYLAGVNRCGTDGNELPYAGGSAVIDYLGQDLVDLGEAEGIATVRLDIEALQQFRERFAFHKDADRFSIEV